MLRINEVFQSIDGETSPFHQGKISTFIRLAGCNLSGCRWCDSLYSQKERPTDRILESDKVTAIFYPSIIKPLNSPKVTITGGEPLSQEVGLNYLIELISKDNIPITIETNGSIKPEKYFADPNISYIVDYKLPSSGMESHMNTDFHKSLRRKDMIKYVIGTYEDYKRARYMFRNLPTKAVTAFQPVFGEIDAYLLLEWMARDKMLEPIISIQIHKLIKVK